MKKILLIISLLFMMSPIYASGIGYVDYNVVASKLPASINYKKQMDAKLLQIKNYAIQSQKIIDSKKTDAEKRKVGLERIAELRKMQKEYNELRIKRAKLVNEKIKQASKAVLQQRKLDAIVSKNYLIEGGIDITQDIIKAAK